MVQAEDGKWLLVCNYTSQEAAEAAVPEGQELINP